MKLIPNLFCAALIGSAALTAAPVAQAQINVNINPAPPAVVGAPADAQYYYVPEIKGYYDVPARTYIVQRNGQWTRLERLEGYNPANFHPQYIEYRGNSPWTYRGGNPSNGALPPGQAKKMGYPANPSNGGLPPGQAKKMYRRDDHDRHEDHDDDRGKGRDGDHGKGHGKGKGRDHDRD